MNGVPLHESLASNRHRYERLVFMRMGGAISREDAEDIVSDALIRAQRFAETKPPEAGKEDAWFGRVVLNQGIDFLRVRDGRVRNGNGNGIENGNGNGARPVLVRLADVGEEAEELADAVDAFPEAERLADQTERKQAQEIVARVMASLSPEDVELVLLRHVLAEGASRARLAEMAGLTVAEFRWRYARAWQRFIEAFELDAPTERCAEVRQLLGAIDSGPAAADVVSLIDAHTLDCPSCRVFARDSYRALELLPLPPAVAGAEHWTTRVAQMWDRSGPEVTAGTGTAAAGAGLWGLLGGGGAASLLKAAAIFCSATAVTAGVCAGVAVVIDDLRTPDKASAERAERTPARSTPTPTATAVATAAPVRTPPARSKPKARATSADTSGESEIPASAPEGASEFSPGGASAPAEPAPATDAGGGEFTP